MQSALIDAFSSDHDRLRLTSVLGFIRLAYFPLTERKLQSCLHSSDKLLAAWAVIYKCRANPKDEVAVLRKALRSQNPRTREFACDEIGDRYISELSSDMRSRLDDEDKYVVQAAKASLASIEYLEQDDSSAP